MNRGTKSRSRSEPPVSNPGLDHWLFGKAIHSDASLLTHRNQTGWSEPVIAPFSGKYRDADPYVSQDGKQLYFISDRPGEGKTKPDMDIWVMDVTESGEWESLETSESRSIRWGTSGIRSCLQRAPCILVPIVQAGMAVRTCIDPRMSRGGSKGRRI